MKPGAVLLSFLLAQGLLAQTTVRVSVSSAGVEGNGRSQFPAISADGCFVAFESNASNLDPADNDSALDVFLHDRVTRQTTLVSVTPAGTSGNNSSSSPALSADGRFVAFASGASELVAGDTNGAVDIFVRDRLQGRTTRVSVDSLGNEGRGVWGCALPAISAAGRFVAFRSGFSNLVPGDTNYRADIFVHDCWTGETTRVSVNTLGVETDDDSDQPSISADGRFVAFQSDASNLVAGDTNRTRDVFLHDRLTRVTSRVSVSSTGAQAIYGYSMHTSISATGRLVVFSSCASVLVPGDINGRWDSLLHDVATGETSLVSLANGGGQGNHDSWDGTISADGRFVAFGGWANNLVPGDANGLADCFLRDLKGDRTVRVSVSSAATEGNGRSDVPVVAAGGRYVTFQSEASNLVSADTNGVADVFLHDLQRGAAANRIVLAGPFEQVVGTPLELSWYCAPPNALCLLACSGSQSGSMVAGHAFDLGPPTMLLAKLMSSAQGTGTWSSAPIHPWLAGRTLYFEIAARDSSGRIFDSVVQEVHIR